MPNIELLMTMLAGTSGGLVGVLWGGIVSAPWLARRLGGQPPALLEERALGQFAGAVLLAFGGAALGLLFWLGWGLISLVNAPWFEAGLLFGLLSWAGVAAPLLGALALRLRDFGRVAPVLAVEWLVTCVAVGMFCAYAWQRYA
jgi:hypothetical protein